MPEWKQNKSMDSKFKRLKRGHRGADDHGDERPGLDQIFSDEEEDAVEERQYTRPSHRAHADEFDDFIEEDYPDEDDEARQREREDMEVARPREKGFAGTGIDTVGLDKDALEDMEAMFGNGEDYDWALQMEEEEEDREREEQQVELKDIFEPSQLAERLLTDEDNAIRATDEPERFQLDRKPFKNLQITTDQFKEEATWIASLMWPQKGLPSDLRGPFGKSVAKVLEFFVIDDVEVPYIFQHRKDYLIHAKKVRNPDHRDDPDAPEYIVHAEKLLNQDDLWRILDLDIKFRSLVAKRNALERTYENVKSLANVQDDILEELIPQAATMEELQDLQDYLQFQYSVELKELAAPEQNGREAKRPGARYAMVERIRKSKVYDFVKAFGITPDRLALNALREGKKELPDDNPLRPIELADKLVDDKYRTSELVMQTARHMYTVEFSMSPRMRKHVRASFYQSGLVNCTRTEKGVRKIDESHPYYEIKYLINQTIPDMARRPELFLKMMKAEEEGLVTVRIVLQDEKMFKRQLFGEFASDNYSELADAWNDERRRLIDEAFPSIATIIEKGVKESLRTACQEEVLKQCRANYSKQLDQAPYQPRGLLPGTIPRVLALSNGNGDANRDPVHWAWVEEDGRVVEHGKFFNLSRDERQREAFVELVQRRKPDVIGVSGYSAHAHRLVRDLEMIVSEKNLKGPESEDDNGDARPEPLEVVVVNDEVARLYKDSERGVAHHPTLHPITRYCVGLARYLQNPLKEYAALGNDILSLSFHPCQQLLPQDKFLRALETAMVDMVNLCGVDINVAVSDPYTANLLPYIAGLGPRKATAVIKAINQNGGVVTTRDELVGDPDGNKIQVVGPRVWNNCASFLYIEYDNTSSASDPLDATRIHPEDYELGRKMCADALELDEEDVKAETDENGPAAIVRKMFKEESQEKVNELILEEYAEQLERNFNQRKRATLETIRAELLQPYEELRRPYRILTSDEIFTMFTGETKETLAEGMTVPVNIRVVKDDFAIAKLDCEIEGRIEAHEVNSRHSVKDVLHVGQIVQAKILELNRKDFTAKLSVREEVVRRPYRRHHDHDRGTWNFDLEDRDREELREKDKVTGRTQRVIKHPLFRPFNATQAEEYLGSQAPGDVVIRPSSKGNDHLCVTWKVADGIYQHIDVLELQKENEFTVGRTLRIGGKYTYSDLDELIVDHVKAMARKVDELMQSDKYQKLSKSELGMYPESPTPFPSSR